MITDNEGNVWPEYLNLRDTQLNDDRGGLGQRIYTTAGQGYKKVPYIRADIVASNLPEHLSHLVTKGLVPRVLENDEILLATSQPVYSQTVDGKVYKVVLYSDNRHTCTCPSFKFREGHCKHIKEVLYRSPSSGWHRIKEDPRG